MNSREAARFAAALLALTLATAMPVIGTCASVSAIDDHARGADVFRFQYVGTWEHVHGEYDGRSMGTSSRSKNKGSLAILRFFGTRIRLFGVLGPAGGYGLISVDRERPLHADFYAPHISPHAPIYEASDLSPSRLHVLKVVAEGSRGTRSWGRYVNIDGVELVRAAPAALAAPAASQEVDTHALIALGAFAAVIALMLAALVGAAVRRKGLLRTRTSPRHVLPQWPRVLDPRASLDAASRERMLVAIGERRLTGTPRVFASAYQHENADLRPLVLTAIRDGRYQNAAITLEEAADHGTATEKILALGTLGIFGKLDRVETALGDPSLDVATVAASILVAARGREEVAAIVARCVDAKRASELSAALR